MPHLARLSGWTRSTSRRSCSDANPCSRTRILFGATFPLIIARRWLKDFEEAGGGGGWERRGGVGGGGGGGGMWGVGWGWVGGWWWWVGVVVGGVGVGVGVGWVVGGRRGCGGGVGCWGGGGKWGGVVWVGGGGGGWGGWGCVGVWGVVCFLWWCCLGFFFSFLVGVLFVWVFQVLTAAVKRAPESDAFSCSGSRMRRSLRRLPARRQGGTDAQLV